MPDGHTRSLCHRKPVLSDVHVPIYEPHFKQQIDRRSAVGGVWPLADWGSAGFLAAAHIEAVADGDRLLSDRLADLAGSYGSDADAPDTLSES